MKFEQFEKIINEYEKFNHKYQYLAENKKALSHAFDHLIKVIHIMFNELYDDYIVEVIEDYLENKEVVIKDEYSDFPIYIINDTKTLYQFVIDNENN